MTRSSWIVAGLAAAAIAGCGATASPAVVTSPAASVGASVVPSAASSVAPPSPDASAAASAYLAAAGKVNADIDKLALPSAPTLEQVKTFYAGAAKAEDRFTSDLLAIHFPASMSEDAKAVVRAADQARAVFGDIAVATSFAEVNAHLNDLTRVRGDLGAAIDVLRSDLGLPRAS